jgi:hypothetical protein
MCGQVPKVGEDMKVPTGRKWLLRVQKLSRELKRKHKSLSIAVGHAAEQCTGLKPRDSIRFSQPTQLSQFKDAPTMKAGIRAIVRAVGFEYGYNLIKHKQPRFRIDLVVEGVYTISLCGTARYICSHLEKET